MDQPIATSAAPKKIIHIAPIIHTIVTSGNLEHICRGSLGNVETAPPTYACAECRSHLGPRHSQRSEQGTSRTYFASAALALLAAAGRCSLRKLSTVSVDSPNFSASCLT